MQHRMDILEKEEVQFVLLSNRYTVPNSIVVNINDSTGW